VAPGSLSKDGIGREIKKLEAHISVLKVLRDECESDEERCAVLGLVCTELGEYDLGIEFFRKAKELRDADALIT
jgi:hypothetical protein